MLQRTSEEPLFLLLQENRQTMEGGEYHRRDGRFPFFPRHEHHGITRPADSARSGIIYCVSGVKYLAEEVLINISPRAEPAEADRR